MPNAPLDGYPYVPDRSGNGMGAIDIPAKVLPVYKGGTGLDHYEVGDLLTADTPITLTRLDAEPQGKVLVSKGEDTMPAWAGIPINGYSGVLPPANGGTGTNTLFTQWSIVFAGAGGAYAQDNYNFNWNDVTVSLGIGGLATADRGINVARPLTGGTDPIGVCVASTVLSDITSVAAGFLTSISTQATPFTLSALAHFYANQAGKGAGSIITSQYGFLAQSNLSGAANNFGFFSAIPPSPTNYNFYATSEAKNHFQGPVTIGHNPALPMEVATKAYVDAATGVGGAVTEAPSDGNQYSRKDASWVKTDTEFLKKTTDTFTGTLGITGNLAVSGRVDITGPCVAAGFYADANYWFAMQGINATFSFDNQDYMLFARDTNTYQFRVAGVTQFSINAGSCQVGQGGTGVLYMGDGNSYLHADPSAATWLWEPGSYSQFVKATNTYQIVVDNVQRFSLAPGGVNVNTHFTVVNNIGTTGGTIGTTGVGVGNVSLAPGGVDNTGLIAFYRPTDQARHGYIGFAGRPTGPLNYVNDAGGGHVFGGGQVTHTGLSDGMGLRMEMTELPTGTNGPQITFAQSATNGVVANMGAIKSYCINGTPGGTASNMIFYVSSANAYAWVLTLSSDSNALFANNISCGGIIKPGNDANFYLNWNGGNPLLAVDTNDYMYYNRANNAFNFVVNGTNPLIVTQSKCGVNVDPLAVLHIAGQGDVFRMQSVTPHDFYHTWYSQGTRIGYTGFVGTPAYQWVLENSNVFYWSSGGKQMTFNQVGHLQLGENVSDFGAILNIGSGTNHICWLQSYGAAPINAVMQKDTIGKVCLFQLSGSTAGWIDIISSALVGYNSSSDVRLKENIVPAAPAGAIIDAIEIVEHDWIKGGHTTYGVIAQDLHPVFPDAVSVGNDELTQAREAVEAKPEVKNKEGMITQHAEEARPAYAGGDLANPWGVDYSKMVPLLIKEIQDLRARVAVLEAA